MKKTVGLSEFIWIVILTFYTFSAYAEEPCNFEQGTEFSEINCALHMNDLLVDLKFDEFRSLYQDIAKKSQTTRVAIDSYLETSTLYINSENTSVFQKKQILEKYRLIGDFLESVPELISNKNLIMSLQNIINNNVQLIDYMLMSVSQKIGYLENEYKRDGHYAVYSKIIIKSDDQNELVEQIFSRSFLDYKDSILIFYNALITGELQVLKGIRENGFKIRYTSHESESLYCMLINQISNNEDRSESDNFEEWQRDETFIYFYKSLSDQERSHTCENSEETFGEYLDRLFNWSSQNVKDEDQVFEYTEQSKLGDNFIVQYDGRYFLIKKETSQLCSSEQALTIGVRELKQMIKHVSVKKQMNHINSHIVLNVTSDQGCSVNFNVSNSTKKSLTRNIIELQNLK